MSISSRAHFRLAVVVGLFSFGLSHSWAATPVIDPATRLQEDLRNAERAMPPKAPPALAEPAEPLQLPEGPVLQGTIFLKEVLFSPSQLLTPAQLGEVVKPYLGRDVGSEDLNALMRDIQALYLAKGIQSAVPLVPQQDLQTGVMKVILVEGTLGQVKFAGGSRADPAWLARWFDLAPGEVIRPEPLARRLDVFNASSDFLAEGQYVAGATFGSSDLEVKVPEIPLTQYWAMGELPGMGSGRTLGNSLIMGFRHFPASSTGGRVDGMAIQGPTATTLSLTGALPLGHEGWRVGGNASASRSRTVVPSTDPVKSDLLIEGASSSYGLDVFRHVYLRPGQMWKFSAGLAQVHSNSQASGATLSDRNVQRLTLAASTDWVVDPAAGAERASFRGAVSSAKGSANAYAFAEIYSTMAYRLAGPQSPVLRATGQLRFADSRPPDMTDAWLVGGSSSVRGFDLGAISGSTGQILQVAMYQPLPWKGVDTPEFFVFADHGRAVKDDASRRIGSAGVGLQFQMDRRWSIETALTQQTHGFQGSRTRAMLRANVSW
jgi:hemolysin activation/secretion protein